MYRRTHIAPWCLPPSNGGKIPGVTFESATAELAARATVNMFRKIIRTTPLRRRFRVVLHVTSMSQIVAGSTGFTRCMSNPASRERRRSTSWPQPVSATSTAPRPQLSARMRRATSQPSSLGMPTSSTTISGLRSPASASASSPSEAQCTSCPSSRSMSARLSSASWLSSAIRILRRTGTAGLALG